MAKRARAGRNSGRRSAKTGKPRGDFATRFKKGDKESARIGGLAACAARAKGQRLSAILRDMLENVKDPRTGLAYGVAACNAMAKQAIAGNVQAFQAIADRTEGKPTQAVEISGPDKKPIKTIHGGMTLEEKARAWNDIASGKVPDTSPAPLESESVEPEVKSEPESEDG
jgi:hypothetical protein